MRPAALAITAALILAGIAGQNAVLRSTEATNSDQVIFCSDEIGAAVQGACSPVSLAGSSPSILSYRVFTGGCPQSDLHVLRYVPDDAVSPAPLIAKWCG
jgi:hypothetical protein